MIDLGQPLQMKIENLELEEAFSPDYYLLNVLNCKTIQARGNDTFLKAIGSFQVFLS